MAAEERKDFELTAAERRLLRIRYVTDGGAIGTKAFVAEWYRRFEGHLTGRDPLRLNDSCRWYAGRDQFLDALPREALPLLTPSPQCLEPRSVDLRLLAYMP
ncbi:MAG: hypothetical protein ACYDA8_11995 [Deferrisomatales bacterium]